MVGPAVDAALRWRYLFTGCVIGLFLITMSLMAGGVVKFRAFPELDGDVVVARVLLPPGAPLTRTEEVVDRITNALQRVNEHQQCLAREREGSLWRHVMTPIVYKMCSCCGYSVIVKSEKVRFGPKAGLGVR